MKYEPLDKSAIKTYSIKDRKSKVSVEDFAKLPERGGSVKAFLEGLPGMLGANDLRAVAAAVAKAHGEGKTIALGMGGHVVKVGLAPLIIELMKRGVIGAIAMNGSCVVHDFESAFNGTTSEDVDAEIGGGAFGMAEETGTLLNEAINNNRDLGLGRAVGEMINSCDFPYKDLSILAAGARLDIPVTVHVAMGTDILHIHRNMDGEATGAATIKDFDTFSSVVATLEGGLYINLGSAVLLPEVFLKALTLVRNIGHTVEKFTTVNMDFIQHYRPMTNVVRRPTQNGGKGYALTGHHEIMFPLLYAAIIENIEN